MTYQLTSLRLVKTLIGYIKNKRRWVVQLLSTDRRHMIAADALENKLELAVSVKDAHTF